jgi:hypothetical protein
VAIAATGALIASAADDFPVAGFLFVSLVNEAVGSVLGAAVHFAARRRAERSASPPETTPMG